MKKSLKASQVYKMMVEICQHETRKKHERGELIQLHIKADTMHFGRLKTKECKDMDYYKSKQKY